MRLRTLLPTLPSRPKGNDGLNALLAALSAMGINTSHDLILQTSGDGLLELPSGILETFNYHELLSDVEEAVAPCAQTGDLLYALEVQEREVLTRPCTSGVKDIDDLFGGNVSPVGFIVEVSGLPGAGKTVSHFLNDQRQHSYVPHTTVVYTSDSFAMSCSRRIGYGPLARYYWPVFC